MGNIGFRPGRRFRIDFFVECFRLVDHPGCFIGASQVQQAVRILKSVGVRFILCLCLLIADNCFINPSGIQHLVPDRPQGSCGDLCIQAGKPQAETDHNLLSGIRPLQKSHGAEYQYNHRNKGNNRDLHPVDHLPVLIPVSFQ